MRNVLKALLVWLMLLAVPFQGYASATMLLCAPLPADAAPPSSAAAAPHDHLAMMANAGASDLAASAAPDQPDHTDHHNAGKCGSCAECCIGGLIGPASHSALAVLTPHFETVPFRAGAMPTVDLELPERPPRCAR